MYTERPMLKITLTDRDGDKPVASLGQRALFDRMAGDWVLSPERAKRERFAYAVHEGKVVMAIEVLGVALAGQSASPSTDDRYRLVGKPLKIGHPVYDAYVGKHAEGTRNPIRYEDSTFDMGACRCGCGAETKSLFLPGHDQRAIHSRIAQVGSVAAFLDWFDETWSAD